MSEDLAHDAHLRAALRHAPDHALAPPSGLSQAILAAARQAHRPVRPTPAPPPPVRMRAAGARPLRAWLRRLFAPRWAGAWAAGLVATLGLGLWLDLELQPTLEGPAVVAMSSARPESANRVEATTRDATSAGQAAADDAPPAAAQAAPAAPARTPENTAALAKQRAAPAAQARVGESAAVRRNEVAAGAERQRDAESASRDAAARQDAAAPAPAAPPAVATAPGSDPPNDPVADTRGRAAAPATAQAPAAPAAAPATEPHTSARSTTGLRAALPDARKAELAETVAVASPALTLLRRAQAELEAGGAVWTWGPPGSAAMVPYDAAARAWLSRVVQAARGRWVEVGERGESLDALEVRWWRDGWPHATMRIEADGLRWIEPGGRIRYAPVDATTLQQLRRY